MGRIVRVGGTCGLVVADWGGMFRKMERAIPKNPHRHRHAMAPPWCDPNPPRLRRPPDGAWDVVARVHHNASGMDCMAYLLRLRPPPIAVGGCEEGIDQPNPLQENPVLSDIPSATPPIRSAIPGRRGTFFEWGAVFGGCCDAR